MGRNRDVVIFVCGDMTDEAREPFAQLVRQAPRWLDVRLAGYTSAPGTAARRIRVGLRTYAHRLFDAHDLTAFGFPAKAAVPAEEFQLIPGNTDLICLRFAHETPHYDRYWFVEDDVRFGGDWAELFEHFRDSRAGLIGTSFRTPDSDPAWHWWSSLVAPDDVAGEVVSSFLPFGAVTASALESVTAGYAAGWQGHYEVVWPTLIRQAGLAVQDIGGSSPFVAPGDENRFYTNTGRGALAPGTFVWRPYHDDYDRHSSQIWHPVRSKPGGVQAS